MPNFFGGVTGKTSATLFEIRLDNDLVILRGSENDSSSQMLSGKVILCLPAQLKVEDVHLRLTGSLKISWNDQKMTASGISNNRVEKTTEVLNHRFAPFVGGEEQGKGSSSKGVVLPAGNYEWPFEYVVPGSTPESVEGMTDTHLSYKLKATVARGKFAYDLHAYKAVRVIRTLDPAALELAHAMTVENVWPNKVEYSINIPQKAIMFGTAIAVNMRFTSLLKGLKIGAIKCFLVESQEYTIPAVTSNSLEKNFKTSRDIGSWTFELNEEEHYQDIIAETGQDGYTLSQNLPLPKSLRKCMQDCETNGIKIRHKVKFNVALHNPDGHTSELRATLPVHIFISPNMPIDEAGNLLDQTPHMTQSQNIDSHAPPLYGAHVLDQLYADIDTSGMMTPAPQSGMSTPFYSQSRAGSTENLHSLDGVANGAVPPHALSNRLQNLAASSRNSSFLRRSQISGSGSNTPRGHGDDDHSSSYPNSLPRQSGYFDQQVSNSNSHHSSLPGSAPRSNPLSRRGSEDDIGGISGMTSGMHTPEHIDFSNGLSSLNKVPSYTTALKTPMRGVSYTDVASLPNYEEAVSRPASPVGTPPATTTPWSRSNHGINNYFSAANGNGSHSGMTTPAGMMPPPGTHMAHHSDADANRRFHLLQLRGRAH